MAKKAKTDDFGAAIAEAYAFEGPALELGRAVHEGAVVPEAVVRIPVSMVNRHGLIAGATGTGKTKTLQVLSEQLSAAGVAVFAADMKGEFLSLGGIGPGVPVRATVSDFGRQLLAKVLEANETQEQSLALVFRFADEHGLPLLDLVVGLEDGGGNEFFGEPQLAIEDLLRTAEDGRGVISCPELPTVQDKPALFSTALMWLVAELFEELPEVGDLPKPKLVFFFDEAHLLFDGATDAFLDSVATTVRMIRSKGIGVFFVTQTPSEFYELDELL
ncbi:MAG: helicase HerA-like domain-containing protein, partial [Thermoleophilaceae bacterium]